MSGKSKMTPQNFLKQFFISIVAGVILAAAATFFVYPLISLDDPDAVTAAHPQCRGTAPVQRFPVYGGELGVLEREDTGEIQVASFKKSLFWGRYLLQSGPYPIGSGASLSVGFGHYWIMEEDGEYTAEGPDMPLYLAVSCRWIPLIALLLLWSLIVDGVAGAVRRQRENE